MPQIKLTALKADLPIGFMAALGSLRQASKIEGLGQVRLGWVHYGGGWCALLETEKEIDASALPVMFTDRVKSMRSRPEFEWSEALKDRSPAQFRERAQVALDEGLGDWFQAFGCELANKDDKIEPTPFDMSVARQQFLADALWLTNDLGTPDKRRGDAPNVESFREALFGPWKYEDNQHSLGWDPSTILMGAFTPKAPTAMNKAGVRAAVWLAMESLPFFPCFYDRRFATSGFRKQGRGQTFRWPIWEAPLTVAGIRVLIEHSVGLEQGELAGRGIAAVYASEVFKPNKYLTSFQAAVLEMAGRKVLL